MSEHQSDFVQQVVGQISNRMDKLYSVIVQQPVAQLPSNKTVNKMRRNYKVIGWMRRVNGYDGMSVF
ncbi:MAG: hypothetical protein WCP96_19570 [Methylococcaceae bacterium]